MYLVVTSLIATLGFVQTPPASTPDFSGTWTMDRSRSQTAASVKLEIKQTTATITVETTRDGTSSVQTYAIDVSGKPESGNVETGKARAHWDGTKLITEVAGNIQGQTVSYKQTWSLNAAATEITIESLVVVQHGYTLPGTSPGSANYGTAKDVYVKTKAAGASPPLVSVPSVELGR